MSVGTMSQALFKCQTLTSVNRPQHSLKAFVLSSLRTAQLVSDVREMQQQLGEIVDSLRRQRPRQGDLKPLLEFFIAQAEAVTRLGSPATEVAVELRSRALQLHRAVSFVPKFVVEDLLEEAVARLEKARRELSPM